MTADVDSGRLGRAHSGSERCGIQRGEHSSGILVDHSQQSASRGFWLTVHRLLGEGQADEGSTRGWRP